MSDPLEHRKKLSFEQAEGLAPLPSQLGRGEVSREFRAVFWAVLYEELKRSRPAPSPLALSGPWLGILRDAHVFREHQIGVFNDLYSDVVLGLQTKVGSAPSSELLSWIEWVFKHPSCPKGFAKAVNSTMEHCRLAYRVFDDLVICPIGSEDERAALDRAFADLAATEINGARAHLRKAAEQLTAGHYADSVRESIHAVEATARILEPSGSLSRALGRLENSANIHRALKHGFGNLYGYTSDEKGIRHPLLDDDAAKVDETDALFMIGACAAFVSYLINKARAAGLLIKSDNAA